MSDPLESEMRARPLATLVLSAEAVEGVRLASSSALPFEACGALIGEFYGTSARVARVRAGANLARDPSRSFDLDPALLVAAEDEARGVGLELIGIWHSHPNAPAELSTADRAADVPGGISLVASFAGGRLRELCAWSRANGTWQPVRVECASQTTRAPENRATRGR